MVRRSRSRSRRGGFEEPAPIPNAPNAPNDPPPNGNDLARMPGIFNMQAFAGPKNITRDYADNHDFLNAWNGAPGEPNANSKQIPRQYAIDNGFKDKWDAIPVIGGRRTRRRHRTRRTRRRGGSRKVDKRHVLLEIGKHLTRSKAMFHATRKHYTHEVAEHTRKGLPDNDKIVHMKKWLAENGSRH